MDKHVQSEVAGDVSCKSLNKLAMDSADMEAEDNLHLSSSPSMVDNGGFDLRPITPESNKETSGLMSCCTSLLALVSSHPPNTGLCMNGNDDDDSPSTPKDGVFNPFAPGPDCLMLAPCSVKYLQESRNYVERRLSFSSLMTKNDFEHVSERAFEEEEENDNDDNDDMLLLEAVYDSLLQCIISKQVEDILGEVSAIDSSSPNAPMTPFGPRLTGIAETCPDAPLKPIIKKSRCIDLSLCRKLELDFAV